MVMRRRNGGMFMRLRFAWDAAEPPSCGFALSMRNQTIRWISPSMTPNTENLSGALLVPRGAALFVQTKDGILQRLEGFEQFVHSGIKICLSPVFFCGADERTGGNSGSDQERQTHTDGRCDPKIVATVGKKIQTKITTHRSPIQKVRFVGGKFTTRELIMAGQFVKQTGFERGCSGNEGGFEGMNQSGNQSFRQFKICVPSAFGIQCSGPVRS